MKKRITSLILMLVLIMCTCTYVYAADPEEGNDEEGDIMPFAQLQNLFPDLSLREDGYVNGYIKEVQPFSDVINSEPIETYTKEYDSGQCWLDIFEDGSYEVYGFEKCDDRESGVMPLDEVGYEISGTYRSYWKNIVYPCSFSYTYTLYTALGTNYSQFHNLSGVSVSGGISLPDTKQYLRAGSAKYVRQTQTSSSPAKVSGAATLVYNDIDSGTFILLTEASYGAISVSKSYG